jgi:predicted membrane protein
MEQLCAPAFIYLVFSLTQILIDSFKGLYNTALIKIIVMFMITFLLQILCNRGLSIISWIIVFVPFILMTVIVTLLLYFFGLNADTGEINYTCKDKKENKECEPVNPKYRTDEYGNIIIYDPYHEAVNNPVYYDAPNIIVPKPLEFPKYISK